MWLALLAEVRRAADADPALADAATVTPYQYTLLVWAVLFGWLFFNETPRTTTLIGAAFIVASGLFIFFREQKLGKAAEEVALVADAVVAGRAGVGDHVVRAAGRRRPR